MDARDLVVVGAGPAGLAVGIAAARAGLDYEILEKGVLVDAIYRFPRGMTFFTTPDLLELGNLPFVSPHAKPTREEVLAYYRAVVDALRIEVSRGEAVRAIRPDGKGFVIESTTTGEPSPSTRQKRARSVVVATGYYDGPNRLGVPGEDLPGVSHYFDEAHPFHGRRVVVVGGSNSAAEAALTLYRAGAQVTLIHRRERLSGSVKYWLRPDLENRIKEGSISARFESRVTEVRPGSLVVESPGGSEEMGVDAVFLLTGYHPDTSLLEAAGVTIDPRSLRPDHDPETFETNVPGLFVAGALTAGRDTNRVFIENGRFHGATIVKAILSRSEAPA
jgi:thioredoxin reductase (NADPH)